jgi:hypothetical protein
MIKYQRHNLYKLHTIHSIFILSIVFSCYPFIYNYEKSLDKIKKVIRF